MASRRKEVTVLGESLFEKLPTDRFVALGK